MQSGPLLRLHFSPLDIVPGASILNYATHPSKLPSARQVVPEDDITVLEPSVLDPPSWSTRRDLGNNRDEITVPVRLKYGYRW